MTTTTKTPPTIGDRETQTVEFKRIYDLAAADVMKEMAKDIAALAAARGGTLWIGVDEDRKQKTVAQLAPMSDTDAGAQEKRLAEAVRTRCTPAVHYNPQRVSVDGGVIVAIEIEAAGQPVAVKVDGKQDSPYLFPIRTGTLTQYRQPDLSDHATARGWALQLSGIASGTDIALGEYAGGSYPDRSPRRVKYVGVDLESLRFTVVDGGAERTWRCADIRFVQPPAGLSPRSPWQIDLFKP